MQTTKPIGPTAAGPPEPWWRRDLGAVVARRKRIAEVRRRRAGLRAAGGRLRIRPGVRDCYLSNGSLRVVLEDRSLVCDTVEQVERVERYIVRMTGRRGS